MRSLPSGRTLQRLGREGRLTVALALPLAAGQISQIFISLADTLMEAVIHQTFGYVFDLDSGALTGSQIEDAFVRDEAVFAFEQDGEISVQPLRDVVGVEDCNFGRLR